MPFSLFILCSGHLGEKLSKSIFTLLFDMMVLGVFGIDVSGIAGLGIELPHSRRLELEADIIGCEYGNMH